MLWDGGFRDGRLGDGGRERIAMGLVELGYRVGFGEVRERKGNKVVCGREVDCL